MAQADQSRFETLDIFRALAATLVMLHHAACVTHLDYVLHAESRRVFGPDYNLALQALSNGVFPVELFIAISGFSLTVAQARRGGPAACLAFYRKRFMRIAPPYYLGVLISAALGATLLSTPTGSHWDAFVPFTGADLLNHFAFINNFFAEKQKINGAYWSIAAEMQMYLFFPILFNALAGGTRRDLAMLAGAALLLGLGAAVWRDFPPNRNLYLFYLMGILAAHCREAILSASARFGGGARGAAVLAIVAYFVLHALGALHKSLIVDLVAVGAFMLLACLGARDGRRPIAALAAKVGLFSYSLYLIHEPAQQLVWQYGLRPLTDSRGWQLGGLVLASFVAIMPLAWLYYRLAERPFMHRRGG